MKIIPTRVLQINRVPCNASITIIITFKIHQLLLISPVSFIREEEEALMVARRRAAMKRLPNHVVIIMSATVAIHVWVILFRNVTKVLIKLLLVVVLLLIMRVSMPTIWPVHAVAMLIVCRSKDALDTTRSIIISTNIVTRIVRRDPNPNRMSSHKSQPVRMFTLTKVPNM